MDEKETKENIMNKNEFNNSINEDIVNANKDNLNKQTNENNINTNLNESNNKILDSPKSVIKKNIRKNSIIPRRFSLKEKHIHLNEMPSSRRNNDDEIRNILNIVEKKYFERNEKENNDLYRFFKSTYISDKLKSDILEANISVRKLCDLIGQFISAQIFNKNDNIYIVEEKSEIIYILLRGNIGLYNLDISYEEMTFEEYLNFLYKLKKKINEKKNLNEENKTNDNDNINPEKEFIDDFLLLNMIEDNKSFYSIRKHSDIEKIEEILFKIKIYLDCNDNNGENLIEIYNIYGYPYTKYNYQDVIDGKITFSQFRYNFKSRFGKREYYYFNQFNPSKNKIKKLKYVLSNYLEEYDYFGNFELIENKPVRNETARCESSKSLLLAINKKSYASLINDEQKNIRDKELEKFHTSFFFRKLNKNFFNEKIYTQFKIIDIFIGDELFKENDIFNNFYILKEGILEISMNNYSILELKNIIIQLYQNIKKYVQMNFILKEKMIHSFNIVKDALNLKRKFLVFTSEKGLYGDYELYFNMPSLFTASVISKKVTLFLYSYEKFNILYNEVYALQEGLKYSAIHKIEKIIERLVSIYNSYFIKIENEFTRKQQEQNDVLPENENIVKNSFKNISKSIYDLKKFSKHIKNNSNYIIYNDINQKNKKVRQFNIYDKNQTKENTNDYNSLINENNNKSQTKYHEFNNLFHSIKINKPIRVFLPPIIINDNSLTKSLNKTLKNINETGFASHRNKDSYELLNFKTIDPYYLEINKTNFNFTNRFERNVPLMRKIKNDIKSNSEKLNHKNKNKIKKSFNITIRDINHSEKFNNVIDKYPGSYYLAVQQYVEKVKNK